MTTQPSVPTAAAAAAFTPYQRRLFAFLGVATFFEGFDMFAFTQILPTLRDAFGLSTTQVGVMTGLINAGTVVAYLFVRLADRWGRRRVMATTILGYTLASFVTGLATGAGTYTAAQFFARMFLIAEWAVAMVYAAEEFPAARRGLVIGVIQGASTFGGIVCAGVAPLALHSSLGWRALYFVGTVPLLLMAVARRSLRETERFERLRTEAEAAGRPVHTGHIDLMELVRGPWAVRVFQLALVWNLSYLCSQNAVTFWKEFAVRERGFTDGMVARSLTVASLASMPMVFLAGRLLDRFGRRAGGLIIYLALSVGVFLAYGLRSPGALTAALVFAVFGVSAVLAVLNAYTSELFPTALRGGAFAWTNNLLGRITYVLSPFALGPIAHVTGWGPALQATAFFPLLALVLIYLWFPETRGRDLDQTSAARAH